MKQEMNKKIIGLVVGLILVILFIIPIAKCQSTGQVVDEDAKADKVFMDSINWSEFKFWARAQNKVGNNESDLPRYIKDDRTNLCFAIYDNFGFTEVACKKLKKLF